MKSITHLNVAIVIAAFLITASVARAADNKSEKLKPYPLETCVVSGEKLGEMGKPFVYQYEGREIKFCCKNCLKDFKKDTAKYIKKIEEAEAKAKKS
jgi:YHS domain-containing protein